MSSLRHDPAARARAFTLIEVVLATAILSVLLAGMGVALAMSAQAADLGNESNARAGDAARVLAQMHAEVAAATAIIERSEDSVEFTIADRDGDGAEETLRYEWSGVAGSPLVRSGKGLQARPILPAIDAFSIGIELQPPPIVTTANDRTLEEFRAHAAPSFAFMAITSSINAAQSWAPPQVPGIASYRISKIVIPYRASRSGTMRLRVFPATSDRPSSGTALVSRSLTITSTASAVAAATFELSPAITLNPGQSVWLVIEAPGSMRSPVELPVATGQRDQPVSGLLAVTSSTGSTWTYRVHSDLGFLVSGDTVSQLPTPRSRE